MIYYIPLFYDYNNKSANFIESQNLVVILHIRSKSTDIVE